MFQSELNGEAGSLSVSSFGTFPNYDYFGHTEKKQMMMDKIERRIDIDDITSLEDMEKFFTLLSKEQIGYHPEVSFHKLVRGEFVNEIPINKGKSFSDEEADRLDVLMDKCYDLTDKLDIDIFQFCMSINEKVRGKN